MRYVICDRGAKHLTVLEVELTPVGNLLPSHTDRLPLRDLSKGHHCVEYRVGNEESSKEGIGVFLYQYQYQEGAMKLVDGGRNCIRTIRSVGAYLIGLLIGASKPQVEVMDFMPVRVDRINDQIDTFKQASNRLG